MTISLIFARIRGWCRIYEAVRHRELDDRALKDLGITRSDIPSAVSGLMRMPRAIF